MVYFYAEFYKRGGRRGTRAPYAHGAEVHGSKWASN